MKQRTVRTKEELKSAVDAKTELIIIKGELAEKLNTGFKIKKASKWSIGILAASLGAVPLTGGMSMAAEAPIAALTGIEIVAIIAVASIGIALIILVCREYYEVRFRGKKDDIETELELKRNAMAT